MQAGTKQINVRPHEIPDFCQYNATAPRGDEKKRLAYFGPFFKSYIKKWMQVPRERMALRSVEWHMRKHTPRFSG